MSDVQEPMRKAITLAELRETIGHRSWVSSWIRIDQAMIDEFARVTGDAAFIHVDPERAAQSRFHGTIAHGLLTLSLIPFLMRTTIPPVAGTSMGINYGFDRVRFLSPVPVNGRVRATFMLAEISAREERLLKLTYDVTIELEGTEEPALIARWLLGRWTV